ncbi:MAG: EamA family transporter [Chloroflexales bacterium]|nr:EamA family transporter [Chloroflexales bacterium]
MHRSPLPHAERGGIGLIAGAALLWGTVGVTTQSLYQLSATNALSIGFFRLALAAPVLLLTCALLYGRAWRLQARDIRVAVLLGALMAVYQVAYFTAISYTGVTIAVLVTLCTAPVIAALLGGLLLRERMSRVVALALAGALLGTGLLVGVRPAGAEAGRLVIGVLFALASALGYASITVCGRLLGPQARPLEVNAVAFSVGALLLLAGTLPVGLATSYTPLSWGLLLYMGLVPTALAYMLFLAGMRRTTATIATLITLLEPLTGALLAWALFGERLAPLSLVGATLLLLSLGLLVWRPTAEPRAKPVEVEV